MVETTRILREPKGLVREFEVSYEALISHRTASSKAMKWLVLKGFFYGPCKVIEADYPGYEMFYSSDQVSQIGIYAQKSVGCTRSSTRIAVEGKLENQLFEPPAMNYN